MGIIFVHTQICRITGEVLLVETKWFSNEIGRIIIFSTFRVLADNVSDVNSAQMYWYKYLKLEADSLMSSEILNIIGMVYWQDEQESGEQ